MTGYVERLRLREDQRQLEQPFYLLAPSEYAERLMYGEYRIFVVGHDQDVPLGLSSSSDKRAF